MQPAAGSLLDTLPLDHAACFSVEGEGEMDVPAVIERLGTDAGASTTLQDLGWQGGVYRQFACKPPPGRVGWVDISVHRFPDAASANEAVAYFRGIAGGRVWTCNPSRRPRSATATRR